MVLIRALIATGFRGRMVIVRWSTPLGVAMHEKRKRIDSTDLMLMLALALTLLPYAMWLILRVLMAGLKECVKSVWHRLSTRRSGNVTPGS